MGIGHGSEAELISPHGCRACPKSRRASKARRRARANRNHFIGRARCASSNNDDVIAGRCWPACRVPARNKIARARYRSVMASNRIKAGTRPVDRVIRP